MSQRAGDEEVDRAVAAWASELPRGRCPDEARWIELAAGDLPPAEAEELREHLSRCPRCVELARDARRFLAAMDEGAVLSHKRPSHERPSRLSVLAVAASVLVAAGLVLVLVARNSTPEERLIRLAESLEVPPVPVTDADIDRELVFRGGHEDEWLASRESAFEPYRRKEFGAACEALVAHAARFAADREARFAGALSCLKGGRVELAEHELAALAAGPGEKQKEAGEWLARVRAARSGSSP